MILQKFLKTSHKLKYLSLCFFVFSQYLQFKLKKFSSILEDLESIKQNKTQNENSSTLISRSIKIFGALNISSCLFKSIVLYKLLKRNNKNPTLHIGVKNIGDLEAHAWIELEGRMLDDDLGYKIFTSIK